MGAAAPELGAGLAMIAGMPFGISPTISGTLGSGLGSFLGGGAQTPTAPTPTPALNPRVGTMLPPISAPSVAPQGNIVAGGAGQMNPQLMQLLQMLQRSGSSTGMV